MRSSAWLGPGSCVLCRAPPGPAALRPSPSREPEPKRRETLLRAWREPPSMPPCRGGVVLGRPCSCQDLFPCGALLTCHVTVRNVGEPRGRSGWERVLFCGG
ncbi:unnamed protein product [Coccothraustes coccothraustes]